MAKARNRRVQVVDLLRPNGIRLPPVHDKDKALDLRRMYAHSSASKRTKGRSMKLNGIKRMFPFTQNDIVKYGSLPGKEPVYFTSNNRNFASLGFISKDNAPPESRYIPEENISTASCS